MEESLNLRENLRQYLKRFLRPTYLLSALAELTVEELFWNASVEKAGSDLACAMHMTVMALGKSVYFRTSASETLSCQRM